MITIFVTTIAVATATGTVVGARAAAGANPAPVRFCTRNLGARAAGPCAARDHVQQDRVQPVPVPLIRVRPSVVRPSGPSVSVRLCMRLIHEAHPVEPRV